MDKQNQYNIVAKYNPKDPEINKYAYWIESPDNILTYFEAVDAHKKENAGPCDYTPDWTWQDMQNALKNNKITIYSSYPINLGTFVTPSKMEAISYGMNKNKPNKKIVPLDYVAWLDAGQGQYTGAEMLNENIQPFELEQEKDRIRDVLDILDTIEYGFISIKDGSKITDRDWIHNHNLHDYYKVNLDPRITLKNKLGICQDQAILTKYLINKYHPEDLVYLYGITKLPKGHCVACYCHNDKWYYIENSWDKEKGLHGYFDSQEELEDYLQYMYFKNHEDDTPVDSEVELFDYNMPLTEATRSQSTAQSRNADIYKYNIRGKNRWERKKYSKVATQVKSYNQINMNDFFKKDLLTITIPVTGETNSYDVQIQMEGVVAEIAKNIKSNGNKFEYRVVIQALTKIFNTANLKVKCTCDDFKYRYAHQLIINNDSIDGSSEDPGPGTTGMADTKGKGCKHILLALANQDWIMKVASVINNYTLYAETNMKAGFDKLIFPKLYGVPIDAADEAGLVPDDTDLATDKHVIETINDFAKNKGKFKKGENKNPVTGSGKLDMEKIKNDKSSKNKPNETDETSEEEDKK